jgi:hypothetical protein
MKNGMCFNFMKVLLVLTTCLFSAGCTSVEYFDDSIPIGKSCAISPNIGLAVTLIDDKPIRFFGELTNGWVTNNWILIPAGVHVLTTNYHGSEGTAENVKSSPYYFEAEHYYFISPSIKNGRIVIFIYDITDSDDKDVKSARKKVESLKHER